VCGPRQKGGEIGEYEYEKKNGKGERKELRRKKHEKNGKIKRKGK
jgi:hypothetical protein